MITFEDFVYHMGVLEDFCEKDIALETLGCNHQEEGYLSSKYLALFLQVFKIKNIEEVAHMLMTFLLEGSFTAIDMSDENSEVCYKIKIDTIEDLYEFIVQLEEELEEFEGEE